MKSSAPMGPSIPHFLDVSDDHIFIVQNALSVPGGTCRTTVWLQIVTYRFRV